MKAEPQIPLKNPTAGASRGPKQGVERKSHGRWFRVGRVLGLCLFLVLAVGYFGFVLPFWGIPFNHSRHGRPPLTPPWALECWLWEDDVNTERFVEELLAGYAKYDFPVRTILIDSPWSARYNDFVVDEARYPEPEKFFRSLKNRGYRVVLWMTCMVNRRNTDTAVTNSQEFFDEARSKGYLAGNGFQLKWWKGIGGFIDYSNPEAMNWWHGLQRRVLDWGVDGWKLDGCDTLFSSRIWKLPLPVNRVYSGWMTTRRYMDDYARGEYRNGLSRNPEFAIMVRAVDQRWTHPEGFAPVDAATVTWMGDNRHTWDYQDRGLEEAIADVISSARLGYCISGTDIAGYHGHSTAKDTAPATAALLAAWKSSGDGPGSTSNEFGTGKNLEEIAPGLYIRWAEFSAFCGFFLNGGHGERRLWKRSAAELEIIRKFSWLHTELLPYIYSQVVECHNGGPPLIRPTGRGEYHYLFGSDFLVAPIFEDKLTRKVSLPPGNWRYLFKDDTLLAGAQEVKRDFPLDEYPVFVREGAIIPFKVRRSYTGLGGPESAAFTTWLIYPKGKSAFTLWHPETHPHPEATTVKVDSGQTLQIQFSGKKEPHLLRIFAPQKPSVVALDGQVLTEGDAWHFEAKTQRLIIRTRSYTEGNYVIHWR